MSEEISHNCGLCTTHSLRDIYLFINSLQHRGREATGIAAIGTERIDVIKWKGPVNTFDLTDLYKIFPSQDYHSYMAHVRYATKGRKDRILEDAHPHVIGGKEENRGNYILIRDCEMVGVHNGQVNEIYLTEVDKEVLKTGCDTEGGEQWRNSFEERRIKTASLIFTGSTILGGKGNSLKLFF